MPKAFAYIRKDLSAVDRKKAEEDEKEAIARKRREISEFGR